MEVLVNKENTIIVSERDVNIVQLYANGVGKISIASINGINHRTVEAVTNRLKIQFGCNTITQLACEFMRKGLIK